MEKKQTALEFFAEQDLIYTNLFIEGKITKAVFLIEKDKLYAACKQMEKERLKDAFIEGANTIYAIPKTFDEWYHETYGGQDESK